MQFIKPSIVGHFDDRGKRHAIYTLDFQPGGHRLATGASDSTVKLWDVRDLMQASTPVATSAHTGRSNDAEGLSGREGTVAGTEDSTSAPAPAAAPAPAPAGSTDLSKSLLATLSIHTKSVNVVRWNASGTLLASGSDDGYILIYRHTPHANPLNSGRVFGVKQATPNIER